MSIRRHEIRSAFGFEQSIIAHVSLPAEPWNQQRDPDAEKRAERRKRDAQRQKQREAIRDMVQKGWTRQDIMGAIPGLSYQHLENHLRALGMKTQTKMQKRARVTRETILRCITETGITDKMEIRARTGISEGTIKAHATQLAREGLIRPEYVKRGGTRVVIYHAIPQAQEAAE